MKIAASGGTLLSIDFGYSVILKFSNGWEFSAETPLQISSISGSFVVTPGLGDSRPLADLTNRMLRSAQADERGRLSLTFEGDVDVVVAPDEAYESWTAVGPLGERIACLPGGELAVWPADKGEGTSAAE